jgi:16S rRNA (guanine966-N2)-methyltransferase
MGDRVRSGLFNILDSQKVLANAEILDVFAGTGAIGLESLSRGAKFATFIEQNKTAQKIIDENITTLNVENRAKLIKTSVTSWMRTGKSAKYDIIFADPPYQNPQFSTVSKLVEYLRENGLMILSYMSRETAPRPNGVVVVDKRNYGEASLVIYRRVDN